MIAPCLSRVVTDVAALPGKHLDADFFNRLLTADDRCTKNAQP